MEGNYSDVRSNPIAGLAGLGQMRAAQTAMGGGYEGVALKQRESGILTETERLGGAISDHERVLAELVSRITPILRQEPDAAGNGGTSVPEAALCHVGAMLRDERRRIELMTGMLREVARRIDL